MSGTLMGLPFIDGCVFILYLVALVAVGVYFSKKVESAKDFSSAGQRLTVPVIMGSVMASWFGAFTGSGAPGSIWETGLVMGTTFLGYHVGLLIMGLMAKQMRETGALTYPDFIAYQFGDVARMPTAIASLLTLLGTCAGQFVACGTMLSLLGVCSFNTGIILGGTIILILTISGGLFGVAMTDTIQQVFITVICVIAVPIVAFHNAGGVSFVFENTDPAKLSWFTGMPAAALIAAFAGNALAFATDPAFAQRVFAAKDTKSASLGINGGNIVCIFMEFAIWFSVFTMPFLFPELNDGSRFVASVIIEFMPPIIKGLGIAAFSSLLITTGDTYLLTMSSVLMTDIYPKIKKNITDRQVLVGGRVAALIVGLFSMAIGLWLQNIMSAITLFYGAYGSAVTVPVLLSCSKKIRDFMNGKVVAAGIFITLFVTAAIDLWGGMRYGVFVGVGLNIIICLVGSAIFKKDTNKEA